jgi:adenylate cyclase
MAIAFWGFGWLETWEATTWDWRASLLAKPGKATDDIRIILLDQNSLDWARTSSRAGWTWPWPRDVYAVIVDYCRRSGAKALAFDLLLDEPSRYGVEDDVILGKAVSAFGRVAGCAFLSEKSGSNTKWPPNVPLPEFKIAGLDKWLDQAKGERITFSRAAMPISELAQNASLLCNVHVRPDRDGIYRQARLFSLFDGKVLPSLGLGCYLAAHSQSEWSISPGRLAVGGKAIPIDGQGNAVLRFRGPSGTHRNYSAAAVIESEIRIRRGEAPVIKERDAFKGKYVFFGLSAPGLYELRSAPVGALYPGVEIHATMLDNFLSNDFIRKFQPWQTMSLALLLALAGAISASLFRTPRGEVVLTALFVISPILFSIGFYIKGFWAHLIVQEIAAISGIAPVILINYAIEGRQKRFIKKAFQHYLSSDIIEELVQHPDRLKLGGEKRMLSIFFSDIKDFAPLSESMAPEALTSFVNEYFTTLTEIIHEEGGTLKGYEGDSVVAFWNAPLEIPDHAVRAVKAALRCQEKLAEMRPEWKVRIGRDVFMRIGINTGEAVLGNLGSSTRFDYSMLGDEVNLTARLEGVNKIFGTFTIMSRATRKLLGDMFASRELARVAVVGRRRPVTIYEPMFREEYERRKEAMESFARGLDMFYSGDFHKALELFSPIETIDPAAAAYVKKCRSIMGSPPKGWEGVWVMTSK